MTTLSHEPFHLRSFRSRKRAAFPRVNHGGEMYPYHPGPGVPRELEPMHRNLYTSAFPYNPATDYPGEFEMRELPVVRIENELMRVSVLPSVCGRVMEIFDKTLNRQLLWSPPSFHFANLALSGAWTLGGVEFNAFRYGHNVHTTSTIETRRVGLASGHEAIAVGAFDELFGCSWEVVLTLVGGTLLTRMNLVNHTGSDQPCLYWWTTLAVPQQWRDLVMLAPGDFLHHSMFRQGYEFDQWPVVHGTDWSQWLNQHEVISGYLPHTRSDFMGYTNEIEGWSFIHRADRKVCQGRKLWSLGSQNAHEAWWENLAEPNWSPYSELQSGLLPLQPDTGIFDAGRTISWTEAFSAVPGRPTASDYSEKFSQFESFGLAKTGDGWETWNDPTFWVVKESETLVPAAPRLEVSKKLILTGSLSDDEVTRAVEAGWVAGAGWIKLLSERSLEPCAKLALGGALLNANDLPAARQALEPLTDESGESGAYANLLLALMAEQEGNEELLLRHLRRALGAGFLDANLLATADKILAKLGRHTERKQLWSEAPAEIRAGDDCRMAQASLAFLDRDWGTVRKHLQEPLLGIAEGASSAWLLAKESFFGEFAERHLSGDCAAAFDLLAKGSAAMPQFGMGRQEDRQNVDFLFYRHALSASQGWSYLAATCANMVLLAPTYPGSPEALYALRTALAENDPSAPARREKIAAWNREAPADWKIYQPLRWALSRQVLEESSDGWEALIDHPIYRYRAAFELTLLRENSHQVNRPAPSNSLPGA